LSVEAENKEAQIAECDEGESSADGYEIVGFPTSGQTELTSSSLGLEMVDW